MIVVIEIDNLSWAEPCEIFLFLDIALDYFKAALPLLFMLLVLAHFAFLPMSEK